MNIFDYRGPEFLQFYGVGLAVVLSLWWLIQWLLRTPGDLPAQVGKGLSPYEVAYVRAGPRGLLQAAAMALHRRELVRGLASAHEILRDRPIGNRDKQLHAAETWLYEQIPVTGLTAARLYRLKVPEALVAQARREELVMGKGRMWAVRLVAAGPLLLLMAAGIVKVGVGIARERPVGFLILLLIFSAVAALVMVANVPMRTRRGGRVLRELRKQHAAMRYCAARRLVDVLPLDAALATALFGVAMFRTGDMGGMARALQAAVVESTGNSSGYGCGAGGGCGGGGCGGGGGGGGCGGCGGGGH